MDVQEHVVAALQKAEKKDSPFPHFFAESVFPVAFYEEIQQFLAKKTDYHSESFANRTFADKTDIPGAKFMLSKEFFKEMLYLFPEEVKQEFGGKSAQFSRELRLIRDHKYYKIGPHTDAAWKVLSLLFYLPSDYSSREHGTSIFVPKDSTFRCAGGPHYPFDKFNEVWRAPFIPNSCLGFWKNSQSFHGVVPIPVEIQRDVLLYNIYRRN